MYKVEEKRPKGFGPQHKGEKKMSLAKSVSCESSEIRETLEIGTFNVRVDGIGAGVKVRACSRTYQMGPLDVRKK